MSGFHSERGWALVPGEYSVKPRFGLSRFTIYIDDSGLREKGPLSDQRHESRCVILGDSFTFAAETRTEKMFTQRLQELLNHRRTGRVEVVNAGVPGYGTAQQLLFMRELLAERKIKPELCVLMFYTNDILDNLCLSYGKMTPQSRRPCFGLNDESRPVLKGFPEVRATNTDDTLRPVRQRKRGLKTIAVTKALAEEWLQAKPGVVRLLSRMGVSAKVTRMPGLLNGWYREGLVEKGSALTGSLIRQLHEEVQESGARLVVSMVPSPLQVYPETYVPLLRRSFPNDPLVDDFVADMLRPQRLVKELCQNAGIPFQDLAPFLLDASDKALFIPRDGHLNDAGHQLIAEKLLPFVNNHLAGKGE